MVKNIIQKEIKPDPVYQDVQVSKFINYVMKDGKKNAARKVVYGAFDLIKKETKKEPLDIFKMAINNAAPKLELKSKRVGGATYQVPIEVKRERGIVLASRWILAAARKKKKKSMKDKLAKEIMEAANNSGSVIKKKTDVHRMAEANRAFAHFAW